MSNFLPAMVHLLQNLHQNCIQQHHSFVEVEVYKYFWRCVSCNEKTNVLNTSLPPMQACDKCNGRKFVKHGLIDNSVREDKFSILGLSAAKYVRGDSQLL